MAKEKELAIKESYSIDKISEVTEMAKVLSAHLKKNKLSMQILGKDYVMVEGWTFAGQLLGFYHKVVDVTEISVGKWMATAQVISRKDDKVVSIGYAICSKSEGKKSSFDEYAILSMAQTRAIGKAYRNLIGWVVKMAGYESTPMEEVDEVRGVVKEPAKPASKFDEMMKKLDRVKKDQLDIFLEKIKASTQYTDEQKNMFTARVMELKQK